MSKRRRAGGGHAAERGESGGAAQAPGAPHAPSPGVAHAAGAPRAPDPSRSLAPAPAPRAPVILAAALVVAAGFALRMWRIGSGLPDFLDEAIPWKTAFKMWIDEQRVDWNPHFFNYPSLTIYLSLFLQKAALALGHAFGRYRTAADFLMDYEADPTALVIAARTLGVLFDALTIVMVVRIGERLARWAGVTAALLVALSPTMIATSRAIYTDTYMSAFSLWALERMLAFRAEGRASQLAAAAILIGLAAGSKYPAALLVLPLAWVLIERGGWRGILPWALAAVAAACVFLITSPYVVLDFAHFRKDLSFEEFHMATGHLGSAGRRGFVFQLQTLAGDIGWIGVALLVVSLVTTLAAPRRRADRVTLWLFLLPVGLGISLARVEAGRYLVPVVPVAAALAAAAIFDLARRIAERATPARSAVLAPAAAALLVAPALPGGMAAGARGSDDTQVEARRWCEAHLPDSVLILREGYTGNLYTRQRAAMVERTRGFRTASADRQRRLRARRVFDVAEFPLIASGDPSVVIHFEDGTSRKLRVFEQPADINQMFYDLRLLHGVDYVMTSGAARGRFQADTLRFPVQQRLYRFLDRFAEHVASFQPGRDVSGPKVDVYRIGDRAREAIMRAGDLHPLWWATYVPAAYRREFEELMVDPEERSHGELVRENGEIAPWIPAMQAFFDQDVLQFTRLLSWELAYLNRFASAAPLFQAIHLMHPEDVDACLAFARCAAGLGQWSDVEAATASTLAAADRNHPGAAELHYLRGLALGRLGQNGEARHELEWAGSLATPGSELQTAAAAEARKLGAARR